MEDANYLYNSRNQLTQLTGDDKNISYTTGKIESGNKDAVEYWNTCGKYTGARSKEVRAYMQNPDNYYLEVSNYNRSSGEKIKNT